ncbi:DUF6456 domain-containing protein [Sinorhizobium sp. BG8]|uniref:DUF6456 domain-containing protein n=1 Tax=Sinorhizobium sp. BG8 TaxID=2613773 RepID=UPI00193E5191|nr:DUF6456 domain-containing protein [Sinorhizobium sp. BG8]QRM56854.1 hypothetical protein F3Y30_09175 [Sinorhizobium sp. BG8]
MSERQTPVKAAPRKQASVASLLRFLLSSGEAATGTADGSVLLAASDGRTLTASPALVSEIVRQGLATSEGSTLKPTPEARGHLRRLLSGGENAFGDQHREVTEKIVIDQGFRRTASVNQLESPLSSLGRIRDRNGQSFLPETALAAGERLHADFTRGGLQPRMTMSWEPRIATRMKGEAGAGTEISDTALAARERVRLAVGAMGPELSGVALDVCCFMKGLETVERERQWPQRSAKLMLRAALMTLARHYAPPAPKPRSHVYAAEDSRPTLLGRPGR